MKKIILALYLACLPFTVALAGAPDNQCLKEIDKHADDHVLELYRCICKIKICYL